MEIYSARKSKNIGVNILVMVLALVTLGLSFVRIFYGVNITDEAFYTAEAMLVNQGATPFVNNWTQAPGATIIYSFLVRIYQILTQNTEGIFLYMRFVFWVYRIVVFLLVAYCFKQIMGKYAAIVTALPLVLFFHSLIPAFSYTSIPMSFLLVVCALIIMRKGRKSESKVSLISGVLMALAVFANPSQIVNCIVLMVMIRLYLRDSWKNDIIRFIIGGLSTALIVSIYLVWRAGSVGQLLSSLYIMLAENPYFKLSGSSVGQVVNELVLWGRLALKYMGIGIIISTVFEVMLKVLRRKANQIFVRRIVKYGTVVGIICGVVYTIDRTSGLWLNSYCVRIFAVGAIICRIACKECTNLNKAFDIIAIPEIVTLFIMGLTVYGGITYRFYVIFPMGLFCIPYCIHICKEFCENHGLDKQKDAISICSGIGVSCLGIVIGIFFNYQYLYGESIQDNCFELSYKVEEGIYKGCYTTEQRGKSLIALEYYIKDSVKEEESVLFMEVVPMAYLMSNAKFCAPTTWDAMLYSYGFNDDTMMQEYFDITGEVPDKVIYIDTGRDAMLSIEKEGYQFNDFINKEYKCVNEDVISEFRIIVYERRLGSVGKDT